MEVNKTAKTILYFTADAAATAMEQAAAENLFEKLRMNVRFRNGNPNIHNSDEGTAQIEKCDYVAGSAPDSYKKVYPFVSDNGDFSAETEAFPETPSSPFASEAPASDPIASEVGAVGQSWA